MENGVETARRQIRANCWLNMRRHVYPQPRADHSRSVATMAQAVRGRPAARVAALGRGESRAWVAQVVAARQAKLRRHSTRARTLAHSDDVSRIAGSQLGSQQSQMLSDARPLPASISAARWHVRLHLATSGDRQSVPSKQRVAGSNPARRAGQRHIAILCLISGSPTGSQRSGWPLQRHFLRTVNRSRLTALSTARGLCDNRAPTRRSVLEHPLRSGRLEARRTGSSVAPVISGEYACGDPMARGR